MDIPSRMTLGWASVAQRTLSEHTAISLVRVLIAASVVAPVIVGGAAFLLIAKALAGSWLWGAVVFAAFLCAYAMALALALRWSKRHPDEAQGFMGAWGRAMAFGSGGWETKAKRADSEDH
jgi:hypothetical protein